MCKLENIKKLALKEIEEEISFLKNWSGDKLPTYYNIKGQIMLLWKIGVITDKEYESLEKEVNGLII